MNENKITSQFALCPYLCPEPRELQPDLDFKIEDTYKTLITTTPAKEDQSRRFRDKLFHELETNLSKIYNFQDKICTNFENDQYNIHGGSLPIFLQKLCDPSVAISTILPVPQMENIDFSELFEHIIVVRIPPDRASWVVHHFMFQCKFTKSQTTDFIKSYEPIPTNLNDYFVKLIYSLYSKNLVHRNSILEWLIEKFHPAHMSPFRTEIFNSYRHLLMVLNSPLMVGYFEMLNSELLFKPSQIVHLLITIEYYLPESKERLENVIFRFANNQILSRAGSILKVIKNDFISFYSNVHRIISLNFPYFDIPSLLSEFQQLIYFSTNNEQTSEMIELFSLVIDFPNEHESIAAVLVEFIKQFRIKFPLEKFVHFLFSLKSPNSQHEINSNNNIKQIYHQNNQNSKNYDKIYKNIDRNCENGAINGFMMNYDKLKEYTIFFYELQSHGIIVYDDFFRLVTHFGLRDPETMTQLLLILPPNNYTQIIRKKIQMIFLKSKEANEKEELFKKYCQDIENYYEEAIHTLPPYFLYQIGYLILNNKEFTFYQKSKMLSQMNLLHMIIPLFKTEEKPIFTVLSVLQMRHLIPLLYSYNCINKFLELVINDSTSRYVEICFLMDQFKKPSSYFKKYEEKIIEIRDKVKLDVSIKTVSELFTEFSYLCNVHILNDFYNVRTVSDLQKSLHCFLSNLLTFNLLNVDYLWKFYLAFIESLCVLPQSWKFFIEVLFYVLLFDYIEITEKIKNVIYEFIYRVISKRIINGCEYLNSIYDIFVSVRIDIDNCENANFLFDILRDIVQEHSYLFTLTNLLSDSVANWLTVSHQYIRDIISPLSNRPVIITESVKHNLLGPPSNFSALVFLLVPKELMVPNMKDVFTYYRMNITNQTMILWTIFLRSRPLYIFESFHEKRIVYYVDGIKYPEGVEVDVKRDIIKPNHVLPEYPDDYRTKISVAFYKLTNIPENSDPTKMNIYLEAWRILCENQKIALLSEQHLIKDLGKPDFSYSPASFNSLRQMFSHLNEVKYEEVCKILFSANVDIRFESELADSQLKFIASFFLMYFAKFGASSSSSNFIIASEKLLKWLPEMYEGQLKSTQFVLDCFNFFTAATANRDNAFQERVRKSTKESIKKIKGKLRNILLLNNPPQKYISKTEPLYLNQEPPISTGDLSSMNTSNSNLNDIFPLDDDDDTLWMC